MRTNQRWIANDKMSRPAHLALFWLTHWGRSIVDAAAVTSRINVSPSRVTLVVEDNGPGIPPTECERVFVRFYRIHGGDSGGCGLGLPIVREFALRSCLVR